jgi:hypothetical protein
VVHLTLCQSLIELLSVDFAGIGCRGHLAFKLAPGVFLVLGVFAIAPHDFGFGCGDTPAVIHTRPINQGTLFQIRPGKSSVFVTYVVKLARPLHRANSHASGIDPSTAAHRSSAPAKPPATRAPASTGQDLHPRAERVAIAVNGIAEHSNEALGLRRLTIQGSS